MRRARVWLSLIVACLLLSAGFVLLFQPPDDTERLMRSYGPVKREYYEDPDGRGDVVSFKATVASTGLTGTSICRDLVKMGWTQSIASGDWVLLVTSGPTAANCSLHMTERGSVLVTYERKATAREQRAHPIRALVGMDIPYGPSEK
jgi:hypothetical protein